MRPLALLVVCALVIGLIATSGAAQSAGMTWKAAVGAESPDHAVQLQDYFPRSITVNAGDAITWTWNTTLAHTVSFLSGAKPPDIVVPQPDKTLLFNPLITNPQGGATYAGTGMASSGFVEEQGKTYTLRFTKPGRYVYACLIHPGMVGTVVVAPKGAKLPKTQAGYDKDAAAAIASQLARGEKLRASTGAAKSAGATGTVYTSPLAALPSARVSLIAFAPGTLTVKAGDTVRWVMKDPYEIHTITFAGAGQVPAFVTPAPQPQGPPKIFFNPKGMAPAGGPVHASAETYYNSGVLPPSIAPGPKAYSLKFTKPGTYVYWCVVHVPQGMRGTIVVR